METSSILHMSFLWIDCLDSCHSHLITYFFSDMIQTLGTLGITFKQKSALPFSLNDVEIMARQVRRCIDIDDDPESVIVEITGKYARIYSSLPAFSETNCRIDMQNRTIIAYSCLRKIDDKPNNILNIPLFPYDTTIKIDDHITAHSVDRMGMGRITSISGHFNNHTVIATSTDRDVPSNMSDGCKLFLLEGFHRGTEKIFWIPANLQACMTYKNSLLFLKSKINRPSFFLDININLNYSDSLLSKNPFRPESIHVRAKYRTADEKFKYEFTIRND